MDTQTTEQSDAPIYAQLRFKCCNSACATASEVAGFCPAIGRPSIATCACQSGPGVAPENIERLFVPFYTTKAGGMGMGLSICRSIIEAHGGRLKVIANVPRGAIFQFTVPVHPS
jgi:nitrogen fixation/metabolism regulation signal transduction histidine kinase